MYTCDNNYVWLMGISTISLFENNKEIEVEINKSKYIKQAIVSAKDNIITVEIVLTEDIQQKIKEIPSFKEEITKIINEYIKEINSKLAEYKKIKKVEF